MQRSQPEMYVCIPPPPPTHRERGGRGRERLIKTESRETESGKERACKNRSARESLLNADSETFVFTLLNLLELSETEQLILDMVHGAQLSLCSSGDSGSG